MNLQEFRETLDQIEAKYGSKLEFFLHGPEGPEDILSGFSPAINWYRALLTALTALAPTPAPWTTGDFTPEFALYNMLMAWTPDQCRTFYAMLTRRPDFAPAPSRPEIPDNCPPTQSPNQEAQPDPAPAGNYSILSMILEILHSWPKATELYLSTLQGREGFAAYQVEYMLQGGETRSFQAPTLDLALAAAYVWLFGRAPEAFKPKGQETVLILGADCPLCESENSVKGGECRKCGSDAEQFAHVLNLERAQWARGFVPEAVEPKVDGMDLEAAEGVLWDMVSALHHLDDERAGDGVSAEAIVHTAAEKVLSLRARLPKEDR